MIAIDTAGCFGRSNRARRAKDADQLFTRAAGVLRPAGAKLDAAGNAAGAEFDLGVAGAFTGLKVVVLQQYRDASFDFSYPRAALEVRREGACSRGGTLCVIGEGREGDVVSLSRTVSKLYLLL